MALGLIVLDVDDGALQLSPLQLGFGFGEVPKRLANERGKARDPVTANSVERIIRTIATAMPLRSLRIVELRCLAVTGSLLLRDGLPWTPVTPLPPESPCCVVLGSRFSALRPHY